MNNLMIDGKKSVAERIVYNAFERVEEKLKKSPVEVFHEASTTSNRRSRFARAGLVVQPTRCRSKSAPSAVKHWRSAG